MICYDLAHVTGWKPYNLHDLARVFSWVGSVCTTYYADLAQPLETAGEEIDDVQDHYLIYRS